MLIILLFILGICIGSFLNVLIDRLPNDENPLTGRSYCDKCKKTLKWYDLIPVLSFILLRGKCRNCHSPISFYYPLVEIITGIMFVGVFIFLIESRITNHESWLANFEFRNYLEFGILNFGFIINYLYYLFIVCSLLVVFFADIKYGIIPDKVIFPAIIISFFFLFFTSKESWLSFPLQPATFEVFANKFSSALGAFIFFLFLHLITRGRGMGLGDVKLALLLGIFLGFPQIITALYIAFLTGAIIGLILIIWRKKKLSGGTIPFGPFLVFGALVSLFFGNSILKIVLDLRLLNFL